MLRRQNTQKSTTRDIGCTPRYSTVPGTRDGMSGEINRNFMTQYRLKQGKLRRTTFPSSHLRYCAALLSNLPASPCLGLQSRSTPDQGYEGRAPYARKYVWRLLLEQAQLTISLRVHVGKLGTPTDSTIVPRKTRIFLLTNVS